VIPRSAYPVLVPQAGSIGALAVIRSLGRAGYPVHAVDAQSDAVGLRSTFASRAQIHPPYTSESFLPWLRAYISNNGIRSIVPSESFILAVAAAGDAEGFTTTFAAPRERDRLLRGMSKYAFFETCHRDSQLLNTSPPLLLIRDGLALPTEADLRSLGLPLFVKTDTVHSRAGVPGFVRRYETIRAARTGIDGALQDFDRAVIQGFAPGIGVGAFFVRWQGRSLARYMHERVHEVPHTGGYSSYRRSFRHDGIYEDAERRLAAMDWDGPAMVEYRFDRTSGRYYAMELNARFWGSLHLALFAGVDFPKILIDAQRGEVSDAIPWPDLTTSCRLTVPGEIQHVLSVIRDPALSTAEKAKCVATFVSLGLRPDVRSDLWFPGDRGLYWSEAWQFFMTLLGTRLRR
jgi:hypothetical protein